MAIQHQPIGLGAPDPELKTSPILEERGDEFDSLIHEDEELPECYFNNVAYADQTYICSGSSALLRCEKGVWVRKGGCDPDNP